MKLRYLKYCIFLFLFTVIGGVSSFAKPPKGGTEPAAPQQSTDRFTVNAVGLVLDTGIPESQRILDTQKVLTRKFFSDLKDVGGKTGTNQCGISLTQGFRESLKNLERITWDDGNPCLYQDAQGLVKTLSKLHEDIKNFQNNGSAIKSLLPDYQHVQEVLSYCRSTGATKLTPDLSKKLDATVGESAANKILLHLMGDVFGKGSSLEGAPWILTMTVRSELLNQIKEHFANHSYIGSQKQADPCGEFSGKAPLPDPQRETLTKLADLHNGAREIAGAFSSYSYINLLKPKIRNLKAGESFFFGGGWNGHGVLYQILKSNEGGYAFRLYNSGEGLEYHYKVLLGQRSKVYPYIEKTNIPLEDLLNPVFLETLYGIQTDRLADTKFAPPYLYHLITEFLRGDLTTKREDYASFLDPQVSGTCSYYTLPIVSKHLLNEYGDEKQAPLLEMWFNTLFFKYHHQKRAPAVDFETVSLAKKALVFANEELARSTKLNLPHTDSGTNQFFAEEYKKFKNSVDGWEGALEQARQNNSATIQGIYQNYNITGTANIPTQAVTEHTKQNKPAFEPRINLNTIRITSANVEAELARILAEYQTLANAPSFNTTESAYIFELIIKAIRQIPLKKEFFARLSEASLLKTLDSLHDLDVAFLYTLYFQMKNAKYVPEYSHYLLQLKILNLAGLIATRYAEHSRTRGVSNSTFEMANFPRDYSGLHAFRSYLNDPSWNSDVNELADYLNPDGSNIQYFFEGIAPIGENRYYFDEGNLRRLNEPIFGMGWRSQMACYQSLKGNWDRPFLKFLMDYNGLSTLNESTFGGLFDKSKTPKFFNELFDISAIAIGLSPKFNLVERFRNDSLTKADFDNPASISIANDSKNGEARLSVKLLGRSIEENRSSSKYRIPDRPHGDFGLNKEEEEKLAPIIFNAPVQLVETLAFFNRNVFLLHQKEFQIMFEDHFFRSQVFELEFAKNPNIVYLLGRFIKDNYERYALFDRQMALFFLRLNQYFYDHSYQALSKKGVTQKELDSLHTIFVDSRKEYLAILSEAESANQSLLEKNLLFRDILGTHRFSDKFESDFDLAVFLIAQIERNMFPLESLTGQPEQRVEIEIQNLAPKMSGPVQTMLARSQTALSIVMQYFKTGVLSKTPTPWVYKASSRYPFYEDQEGNFIDVLKGNLEIAGMRLSSLPLDLRKKVQELGIVIDEGRTPLKSPDGFVFYERKGNKFHISGDSNNLNIHRFGPQGEQYQLIGSFPGALAYPSPGLTYWKSIDRDLIEVYKTRTDEHFATIDKGVVHKALQSDAVLTDKNPWPALEIYAYSWNGSNGQLTYLEWPRLGISFRRVGNHLAWNQDESFYIDDNQSWSGPSHFFDSVALIKKDKTQRVVLLPRYRFNDSSLEHGAIRYEESLIDEKIPVWSVPLDKDGKPILRESDQRIYLAYLYFLDKKYDEALDALKRYGSETRRFTKLELDNLSWFAQNRADFDPRAIGLKVLALAMMTKNAVYYGYSLEQYWEKQKLKETVLPELFSDFSDARHRIGARFLPMDFDIAMLRRFLNDDAGKGVISRAQSASDKDIFNDKISFEYPESIAHGREADAEEIFKSIDTGFDTQGNGNCFLEQIKKFYEISTSMEKPDVESEIKALLNGCFYGYSFSSAPKEDFRRFVRLMEFSSNKKASIFGRLLQINMDKGQVCTWAELESSKKDITYKGTCRERVDIALGSLPSYEGQRYEGVNLAGAEIIDWSLLRESPLAFVNVDFSKSLSVEEMGVYLQYNPLLTTTQIDEFLKSMNLVSRLPAEGEQAENQELIAYLKNLSLKSKDSYVRQYLTDTAEKLNLFTKGESQTPKVYLLETFTRADAGQGLRSWLEKQLVPSSTLDSLQDEILNIFRKKPEEKAENARRTLMEEGRIVKSPALKELFVFYANKDIHGLQVANPYLSEADIRTLLKKTTELLLKNSYNTRVSRLMSELDRLVTGAKNLNDPAAKTSFLVLATEYMRMLQQMRAYDVSAHPEYLVFENTLGILLYQEQVQKIGELEGERGNPSVGALVELIMAAGKTSVILPLLSRQTALEGKLSIVVLPESLLPSMLKEIEEQLGSVFNQAVERFEVKRKDDNVLKLTLLYDRLNECFKTHKVVFTSNASIQSLFLIYVKMMKDKVPEGIEIVQKIFALLKDHGHVLIDEVDLILNIMQSHRFADDKQDIDENVVNAVFYLYGIMINDQSLMKEYDIPFFKYPGDENRLPLTEGRYQEFREKLAKRVSTDLGKPEVLQFLIGNDVQKSNAFLKGVQNEAERIFLKTLYEEFDSILSSTIKKIFNVNYGFFTENACKTLKAKDPKAICPQYLAIPYHSGQLQTESRFGNVLESLNYSVQMLLQHEGLANMLNEKMKQLKSAYLKADKDRRKREEIVEHTKSFLPDDNDDPLRVFRSVNLTSDNPSQTIMDIAGKLKNAPAKRLYLIKAFLPAELSTFGTQLQTNSFIYPVIFKNIRGMSGTLWNYKTFPHFFSEKTLVLSDAMEKTLLTVWGKRLDGGKVQVLSGDASLSDDFFRKLQLDDCSFIDQGGFFKGMKNVEVIKKLLSHSAKQRQYGIFYDDEQNIQVFDKLTAKVFPYKKSELDRQKACAFWDIAHTEGSDNRVNAQSVAKLTFNRNSILRDLLQAAWRLRELNANQNIKIVMLEKDFSIAQALLEKEFGLKIDRENFGQKELFAFLMINQINLLNMQMVRSKKAQMEAELIKNVFERAMTLTPGQIADAYEELASLFENNISKDATSLPSLEEIKKEDLSRELNAQLQKKHQRVFEAIKALGIPGPDLIKLVDSDGLRDNVFLYKSQNEGDMNSEVEVEQEQEQEQEQEPEIEPEVSAETRDEVAYRPFEWKPNLLFSGSYWNAGSEISFPTINSIFKKTFPTYVFTEKAYDEKLHMARANEKVWAHYSANFLKGQVSVTDALIVFKSNGELVSVVPVTPSDIAALEQFFINRNQYKNDDTAGLVFFIYSLGLDAVIRSSGANTDFNAMLSLKDTWSEVDKLLAQAKYLSGQLEYSPTQRQALTHLFRETWSKVKWKDFFRKVIIGRREHSKTFFPNSDLDHIFRDLQTELGGVCQYANPILYEGQCYAKCKPDDQDPKKSWCLKDDEQPSDIDPQKKLSCTDGTVANGECKRVTKIVVSFEGPTRAEFFSGEEKILVHNFDEIEKSYPRVKLVGNEVILDVNTKYPNESLKLNPYFRLFNTIHSHDGSAWYVPIKLDEDLVVEVETGYGYNDSWEPNSPWEWSQVSRSRYPNDSDKKSCQLPSGKHWGLRLVGQTGCDQDKNKEGMIEFYSK